MLYKKYRTIIVPCPIRVCRERPQEIAPSSSLNLPGSTCLGRPPWSAISPSGFLGKQELRGRTGRPLNVGRTALPPLPALSAQFANLH